MPENAPTLLDLFGPVMIGPSSSHTAGVARIAYLARKILKTPLERARITFYGSLARTWKGHGSDKAAIAGLLGILPEDERLAFAPEIAQREGLEIEILSDYAGPERYHTNTVVLELEGGDERLRVRGSSIGGGEIRLKSVNGFQAELDGGLAAILVLHHDEVGVIAELASLLAAAGLNIASLASHRRDKGDEALIVAEVDGAVSSRLLEAAARIHGVLDVVHVPSIKS